MKAKFLLLAMTVISILAIAAKPHLPANELLGKWKYTISNVPPEYETGVMTFEEKDGKTIGYLGDTERLDMKELTIDQNKVAFKLDFQGGVLSVNMVQDGAKLSGTLVTQDGEFPINAVKEEKK